MKKFLCAAAACLPLTFLLTACTKKTDYFNYVSEYRKSVYFYEDDAVTLKIYNLEKETPCALDGIKGSVNTLTEIYYSCEKTANEVEIELNGQGGEMSYLAVTRNYYLSFSGELAEAPSVQVKVTVDGNEKTFDVLNVAEEGTIDGKTALKCVYEYDGESFEKLTEGKNFNGEILIRLLYDEGCYYYVGICDRDKNVHAYLVNGADGRIIAERESTAEN